MNWFATGRKSDLKGHRVVVIKGKSRAAVAKSVAGFIRDGWAVTGPVRSTTKDKNFSDLPR
jgi:hypothetical protein